MARVQYEADKYISNTDSLMSEIGDISTGNIKSIIDDYNDISAKWNDFLDDCISEVGGTFSGSSEQEKIDYLREKNFYGDRENFLSKLQGQVVSDNSKKMQLKRKAEEVLKRQQELVQKNAEAIKALSESLKLDLEKKSSIQKEIDEKTNRKSAIKDKIDAREKMIEALKDEIKALDPTKDQEAIKAKREKIAQYNDEIKDLADENNDLEAEITTKTKEKAKIVIGKRQNKIDELSTKNKELQKHMDDNYKDLNEKFSKDGISIERPGAEMGHEKVEQTVDSPEEEKENENKSKTDKEVKGSAVNSVPENNSSPASQENAMVKLTDKQISMNLAKEFRESKTLDEQRKMINSYGYTDLVAMMPYLGLIERKRMFNVVREARDELIVPDEAEFVTKIGQMTGDPSIGNDWYNLLFEQGTPRDFKRIDVEELRDIQRAIETINANRNEIAKQDPELLEYFENNFAQFVKTGSLMERVKTGRIKGFFADMVKGKQKAVRDKLAGSMRDYTMARQDEKVEKLKYENSIRGLLGKDVKPVPDPSETNRGDTRFESQPQKLDRKNTSRQR